MTHRSGQRWLLLFDIDGTLLRYGSAVEHAHALISALRETYGVELADDAVTRIRPFGKTDQRIAREILEAAGLPGSEIEARRDVWMRREWEIFRDIDLARLHDAAMPGAAEALARSASAGHVNALLTGNIEPVAYRKLSAAGLGGWFAPGQGAFGSDAEDRNELVPIALERAGRWPATDAVVVGDAPGDVACALAGGVRVVALTGHFSRDELKGAHVFINGLGELDAALSRLAGA
ncbi:MAG: HAD family hydrolase [Thermoleophilaceae bacterium]